MAMSESYPSKALTSQLNETSMNDIPLLGDIPSWLSGFFISNGPAQFEVNNLPFNHWFDGLAMLKKFQFQHGKVHFQNRFLRSLQFEASYNKGTLNCNEFGTYADKSLLKKIARSFETLYAGLQYDNCNVNLVQMGDSFLAMTETDRLIIFNRHDLATKELFKFSDSIKNQLMTAHPHTDRSQNIINVSIEVGHVNKYHIFNVVPSSLKREMIKTYISDEVFYMHSFGLSANYIILIKSPLLLNKYKLALGLPFNHSLYWSSLASSFFIIIDKRNGQIHEIETDAFVCLHHVNAFEMKETLIVDLIYYEKGNPYNYFYLSNLKSQHPKLPTAKLRRYKINMQTKRCQYEDISTVNQEFPRIHYPAYQGRDYQFVYTSVITNNQQPFFDAIQKTNVQTGATWSWHQTGYFTSEPVFVMNPMGKTEDEGVLLFIVFNASKQTSSLVILNAVTMQQTAEVMLPLHLPFGLHGNFYPN